MLSELYIENIALIKKASVRFDMGLNVLTGETGAGKTILINAIQAIIGERMSRDLIRTGEKKAVISALFTELSPCAAERVSKLGFELDEDGALLVQREISTGGNSCRVNGMPATVSTLKQLGECLLVIHGQQDTGALADAETHRDLIDSFGDLGADIAEYGNIYKKLTAVRDKLSGAQMSEAQKAQRADFLTFQIGELSSHNLIAGEEDALTARRDIIRNAHRIASALTSAVALLDGEDCTGAADAAIESASQLERISQFLPEGNALVERLRSAGYELRDISETLISHISDVEYDPGELDELEGRLDLLQRLGRKYGGNCAEMLQRLELMRAELDEIMFAEEHLEKLRVEEEKLRKAAEKAAEFLTKKRAEAGERFCKLVRDELSGLDMPNVMLESRITPRELGPLGADALEIFFSANRGEELKPLSKIASGGEMSRTMLAIKNVLSGRDAIDTLIFDEIDSGVSGRAAHKIGEKLGQASKDRQILCVTHLAQVAAFANCHLLIEKQTDDRSTFTKVLPLQDEGRIRELARITGGEVISATSMENAKEMLEIARRIHTL